VRSLVLLRFQHVDISFRGIDRCLRALNSGGGLIPVGLRLLERLTARIIPRGKLLLALEFKLRARVSPASDEASCALAWSMAARWAAICLSIRLMVACSVATLSFAVSTASW